MKDSKKVLAVLTASILMSSPFLVFAQSTTTGTGTDATTTSTTTDSTGTSTNQNINGTQNTNQNSTSTNTSRGNGTVLSNSELSTQYRIITSVLAQLINIMSQMIALQRK